MLSPTLSSFKFSNLLRSSAWLDSSMRNAMLRKVARGSLRDDSRQMCEGHGPEKFHRPTILIWQRDLRGNGGHRVPVGDTVQSAGKHWVGPMEASLTISTQSDIAACCKRGKEGPRVEDGGKRVVVWQCQKRAVTCHNVITASRDGYSGLRTLDKTRTRQNDTILRAGASAVSPIPESHGSPRSIRGTSEMYGPGTFGANSNPDKLTVYQMPALRCRIFSTLHFFLYHGRHTDPAKSQNSPSSKKTHTTAILCLYLND